MRGASRAQTPIFSLGSSSKLFAASMVILCRISFKCNMADMLASQPNSFLSASLAGFDGFCQ